jgi:leucyl-tRNA synthetase
MARPVERGRIEKMSKSKKNVVDPDPMFDQYGADAVRWFMLSDSPPERDLEWSESGIEGTWRFVNRVWRLVDSVAPAQAGAAKGSTQNPEEQTTTAPAYAGATPLDKSLHRAIAGYRRRYRRRCISTRRLPRSTALSTTSKRHRLRRRAPPQSAPCRCSSRRCCRIWPRRPGSRLAHEGLIAGQPWPEHDPALLVDDEVTIAVQVMGKLRDTLTFAKGSSKDSLEALALASEKVQRAMDGASPKKIIVVPDRLVNIVI